MTPIVKNRLLQVLRVFAAGAALVFLASTSPIEAAPLEFSACSQCHPDMTFAQCAGLVNYTISSCCGSGNGWAHCVNEEWGFYVNCTGAGECNCDMWGSSCDNWWPAPVY